MATHFSNNFDLRSPLGRHLEPTTTIRDSRKHGLDRRGQLQQDGFSAPACPRRLQSVGVAPRLRLECWRYRTSYRCPCSLGPVLRPDTFDLFPHDWHFETDDRFLSVRFRTILRAPQRE